MAAAWSSGWLSLTWAKTRKAARFTVYAALILSLAFGLAVVIESYRIIREAAFLTSLEPVAPTGNSPGLGTLVTTAPPTAPEETGANVPALAMTQPSVPPPSATSPSNTVPATGPSAPGTGAETTTTGTTTPPSSEATATGPTGQPPTGALGSLDDLTWPATGQVAVAYGWQASATHGDWRMHTGIDVKLADGAPIRAAAAGQVLSVERDLEWAVTVTLAHAGEAATVYANLSGASVKVGDFVAKGETIGRVGASGTLEVADGPHLHFEVRVKGEHTDPKEYLK